MVVPSKTGVVGKLEVAWLGPKLLTVCQHGVASVQGGTWPCELVRRTLWSVAAVPNTAMALTCAMPETEGGAKVGNVVTPPL